MGPSTPRSTPKAAKAARQNAIDKLNAQWDFGIPRPGESSNQDEDIPTPSKLAAKCSTMIYYLCFRAPDLDLAIENFEQEANLNLPGWQWKDNQSPGTLPGQLANNPRQIQQRQAAVRRNLDSKQRASFMRLLVKHLKDKMEEVQTREKSFSTTNGAEASASHPETGHQPLPPGETATKRRVIDIPEVCHTSSPVKKRLPPIKSYFEASTEKQQGEQRLTTNPVTSFETEISEATQVFSQPLTRERSVSPTTPPPPQDSPSDNGSQDYFPSQLAEDLLRDPIIRKSFNEAEGIDTDPIEPSSQMLSSFMSTLSSASSTQLQSEANDIIRTTATKYYKNGLHKNSPFVNFNSITVSEWRQAQGLREDGTRSITQSGSLKWRKVKNLNECPFTFTPNPLRLETSCRFHRHFGSDRFMIVYLPPITGAKAQGLSANAIREIVALWLARDAHRFLKRKWRAFYVELEKGNRSVGAIRQYKVHLFAESGEGVDKKIYVRELLQWHSSIRENISSTDCKLFQRLPLGLSKTRATVVLEQSEFASTKCSLETIMNDGCARMSESLAREISMQMGITVPAVFQGRIAGAKGVWMVEKDDRCDFVSERGFYIEVSEDSQLKINPHPMFVPDADPAKRTFEVLDYSRPPRSADLNLHFITILADRGVPRDTLERHLLRDSKARYEELSNAWNDPLLLRAWINTAEMVVRDRGIEFVGCWPTRFCERAIALLENGFEMKSCGVLVTTIQRILQDSLSRYVEAFKIRIPLSTTVFCIADPYGILAEDEVHLGFSILWEDEETGFQDNILHGLDVLVARSPAFLRSDIQRRKARWKPELRHFRDVIVFPTTGNVPLAHLLSGGDYDGDKVWVCWDQSLVEPFRNKMPPPRPPTMKECGIESASTKLSSIFQNGESGEISRRETRQFFQQCFSFNLENGFLGYVATEFRRLAYDQGTITSPEAVKLATMASYLVDAAKAGSRLSEENWKRVLKEVSPMKRSDPAHRDPNATERMAKKSDVLDYLKFFVAKPEKDRILTEYHQRWKEVSEASPKDDDLTQLWNQTYARAAKESKDKKDKTLLQLLNKLGDDVSKARDQWSIISQPSSFSTPFTSPSKRTSPRKQHNPNFSTFPRDEKSFNDQVNRLHTHIRTTIVPTIPSNTSSSSTSSTSPPFPPHHAHPLHDRYLSELSENVPTHLTHWSLLRASCIYNLYPHGMFAWYVAGAELCELKRRARSRSASASSSSSSSTSNANRHDGSRAVLEPFYRLSRFDGRAARKASVEARAEEPEGGGGAAVESELWRTTTNVPAAERRYGLGRGYGGRGNDDDYDDRDGEADSIAVRAEMEFWDALE